MVMKKEPVWNDDWSSSWKCKLFQKYDIVINLTTEKNVKRWTFVSGQIVWHTSTVQDLTWQLTEFSDIKDFTVKNITQISEITQSVQLSKGNTVNLANLKNTSLTYYSRYQGLKIKCDWAQQFPLRNMESFQGVMK